MRFIVTGLLASVGAIFGAGVLVGAGFVVVGQTIVRWWAGRVSDPDEWTRTVIRTLLAARSQEAKVQLLQDVLYRERADGRSNKRQNAETERPN